MEGSASARRGSCTRPLVLLLARLFSVAPPPPCSSVRRSLRGPLPLVLPEFAVTISSVASCLRVLASVLILSLGIGEAAAQEIRYLYDDLGRLIGVVDQQGNAARYVYDAAGNLLEIRRVDVADFPGPVAITFFDPNRGQVGTPVTIFGRGFSTTAGDNQVAFNGGPATVTASTGTSLTTSVPPGATTGPISVTVPLVGSATSREPFTVLQGFAVTPAQADVVLGGSLGFQATLDGTPTTAVTWRVNGTVGGTTQQGTITPGGAYTAPAAPPPIQPVLVEAVLTSNPTQIATATVRVVGQAAGLIGAAPVSVASAAAVSAQAAAGPVSVQVTPAIPAEVVSGPVTVALTPAVDALAVSGAVSVTGGPVVSGLAPGSAPAGSTGLAVTVTGANLQGASAVQWLRNGLADATPTASGINPAPDGTAVTFTLAIGATAPLGPRVLRVGTPQGTSTNFDLGTNTFTVTAP